MLILTSVLTLMFQALYIVVYIYYFYIWVHFSFETEVQNFKLRDEMLKTNFII